jgi:hypothetical protein
VPLPAPEPIEHRYREREDTERLPFCTDILDGTLRPGVPSLVAARLGQLIELLNTTPYVTCRSRSPYLSVTRDRLPDVYPGHIAASVRAAKIVLTAISANRALGPVDDVPPNHPEADEIHRYARIYECHLLGCNFDIPLDPGHYKTLRQTTHQTLAVHVTTPRVYPCLALDQRLSLHRNVSTNPETKYVAWENDVAYSLGRALAVLDETPHRGHHAPVGRQLRLLIQACASDRDLPSVANDFHALPPRDFSVATNYFMEDYEKNSHLELFIYQFECTVACEAGRYIHCSLERLAIPCATGFSSVSQQTGQVGGIQDTRHRFISWLCQLRGSNFVFCESGTSKPASVVHRAVRFEDGSNGGCSGASRPVHGDLHSEICH